MKENKQAYVIGIFNDKVLFYHCTEIDFYKPDKRKYVITKDLKIEYNGILYNGYDLNLKFNLDLKQFKIEIFE